MAEPAPEEDELDMIHGTFVVSLLVLRRNDIITNSHTLCDRI